MKKATIVVMLVMLVLMAVPSFAAQKAQGGVGPMLASCCLGPRIGLEYNEGKEIRTEEWLTVVPYVGSLFRIFAAYEFGYKNAQIEGFFASCCLGIRVGEQLNQRNIRDIEWLQIIPIVNIYPWVAIGLEAYDGKTMTQIEKEENLKK